MYIKRKIFTKIVPSISTEFRDYIDLFNKSSFEKLKKAFNQRQHWQGSYTTKRHNDFNWIRSIMYGLVREYEADDL